MRIPNRIRGLLAGKHAFLLVWLKPKLTREEYKQAEKMTGDIEDEACKWCDKCEKQMEDDFGHKFYYG